MNENKIYFELAFGESTTADRADFMVRLMGRSMDLGWRPAETSIRCDDGTWIAVGSLEPIPFGAQVPVMETALEQFADFFANDVAVVEYDLDVEDD